MENPTTLYHYLIGEYGLFVMAAALVAVVMLIIQLRYYIFVYGRIASYHGRKRAKDEEPVPVSVIIPLFHDDFDFLQNSLLNLLNQSHPHYEIVLVDIAGSEEFSEQLKAMCLVYARLKSTKMIKDERFPINNKMALNVGIKAARYDHLIISSAACRPTSKRWLELMARGFSDADVVIGYCGLEPRHGFENKLIRCSRVAVSARWLCSAMRRRPYRGNINNLGFTKSVYFNAHGFNFLNLNIGEDDLFVMKIARHDNTAVVVSGAASVKEKTYGDMKWWHTLRRNLSYTYRYYPTPVKISIGTELWSRFLFFVSNVAIIAIAPLYGKIFAAVLLLLRLGVVMFEMTRVCKRLSEKRIMRTYPIYDVLAPLCEAELAITRRFKSSRQIWR